MVLRGSGQANLPIEPSVRRVEARVGPEVPLPDDAGPIARRLQQLGDRALSLGEA